MKVVIYQQSNQDYFIQVKILLYLLMDRIKALGTNLAMQTFWATTSQLKYVINR